MRRSSLRGGRLLTTRTNTKARNIPLSKHNHSIACEGVCYGLILPVLRYATVAGCIALQETIHYEIPFERGYTVLFPLHYSVKTPQAT